MQKLALRAADVFILPDAYETKQEGKYLRYAKICVMLNGTEYACGTEIACSLKETKTDGYIHSQHAS